MEEQGASKYALASWHVCSLLWVQAVVTYVDITKLEQDTALEAAMISDDDDFDWVY